MPNATTPGRHSRPARSRRAASFALWIITSAAAATRQRRLARRRGVGPVADVSDVTSASGRPRFAPASNAVNVLSTEGIFTPPSAASLPVFETRAPRSRARRWRLRARTRSAPRWAHGRAAGRDEHRLRVVLRDVGGGVLELEAVTEHEIEAARREVAEAGLEVLRRLRLLVRDLRAELGVDLLEPFVRALVPAAVADRARSEQSDLERGRRGGARGRGGPGAAAPALRACTHRREHERA